MRTISCALLPNIERRYYVFETGRITREAAPFAPAKAIAVGHLSTPAEREQLDSSPTRYGPRAVDWSACQLAARFAPDYVRHSAKQQKPATKIPRGLQLRSGVRFSVRP